MKQFEFLTLKLFVAVAETGSVSAAAERSSIAAAAISKRITDMEHAAGGQFFYRHARGMALTPAGRELLQHAREIIFSVDRMHNDLSGYANGIKGHVRVAATGSAVSEFLPHELKRFGELHPNIVIDLTEWTSQRIVDAVMEGRAEMGIFIDPHTRPDLVTFPYREDELCIVVPTGHPLAGRPSARFADITAFDFIGLEPQSSIGQMVATEGGAQLRLRINVRSTDGLCRMVAAGLGIGIAPRLVVETHVKSMSIEIVPLAEPWAQRSLLIGVRSEEGLSTPARIFLQHCRAG
ncbi:LysR family transcriptional regulator [Hydrogenophaga sp. BPS33]|uniref:LysR family transcriptional regulator n=1 Tax=Hydrogenophaga sp. BPS33 TaxID=2651974 RepID=UPI0013201888|nr:LysR family transcriptional regulator [Hydrogenophaga sp. BPS33]QHE85261.1 LysR family transcriptional regulator [Hydrogenophaga sp. BPS33]